MTGAIKPARPSAAAPSPIEKPTRASPINDTVIFVAPPDREARLQSRELPTSGTRIAERASAGGVSGMLARISLSLDKVEQKQGATLTDLEERIDTRARRMQGVLSSMGVNLGRASADTATGGPFVPARPPQSGASSFERQLYRINVARAQIDRYNRTLLAVPVRKPIIGEVDMSSPFGMRMDPFVKGPAIHTGIDLRGDTGDPVRATANGRVAVASWQGGYGKMVEIDHGNGLSTRYGHIPAIDVKVGDKIPDRTDHRQDRLDRPLHGSAPALRNTDQRRSGRSPAISASWIAARQYLGHETPTTPHLRLFRARHRMPFALARPA